MDVVIRLEGSPVERRMTTAEVLPSGRLSEVYASTSTDKLQFNSAKDRFLFLDGWLLHDTGEKPRGFMDQSIVLAQRTAAANRLAIDRVYFYGSSAGGRSVLDLAPDTLKRLGCTMLGVADGHFDQRDTPEKPRGTISLGFILTPDNIPSFGAFQLTQTTPPDQRFNWFQRVGNHGKKTKLGFGEFVFTSNSRRRDPRLPATPTFPLFQFPTVRSGPLRRGTISPRMTRPVSPVSASWRQKSSSTCC